MRLAEEHRLPRIETRSGTSRVALEQPCGGDEEACSMIHACILACRECDRSSL